MTIKHKTWSQDKWTRAGISVYREVGDFYSASGLFPTKDRTQMRRGPAWSSVNTTVLTTDTENVRALFYNRKYGTWCFVGHDSTNAVQVSVSSDLATQDRHFAITEPTDYDFVLPGGRPQQNAVACRDYLYFILTNGKVFYAKQDPVNDWSIASDDAAAGNDMGIDHAAILQVIAGDLYVVDKNCNVYKSSDQTTLTSLYTATIDREPIAAIAYRGKLHIFVANLQSTLDVIEIDLPSGSSSTATMSFPCGRIEAGDLLACQHAGLIWFAAGRYILDDRSAPASSWSDPGACRETDGASNWTNESNAIDGDKTTNYAEDTLGTVGWQPSYLEFDIYAITDQIQWHIDRSGTDASDINRIQVDILSGGVWITIYDGDPQDTTDMTVDLGRVIWVDQARFRAYNDGGANPEIHVYALEYNAPGHGDYTYGFDIYTYDGDNSPNYVTHIEATAESYNVGFLPWNGELIFYILGAGASSETHTFKLLLEEGAVDLDSLTGAVQSDFLPVVASAVNTLVVTSDDGTDNGHYHADLDDLADGYVISSRLDMGNAQQKKRLNSITVLMDDCEASFHVKIHYRLDDDTSWTQAVSDNGTQRIFTDDIGEEFYVMQLKVEIDDDAGNESDFRIDKITVHYSEGF